MNKIFFYNIIFFSFLNFFCGGKDNYQYLLNVINEDKTEANKLEKKDEKKIENLEKNNIPRTLFGSYEGLNINKTQFMIYENSDYEKYKEFIEEYLIGYFSKILDKKDELDEKNLNFEFIKIFIVKLLTDYFPLNLEDLNFKKKEIFKENIKKSFLEKFFDFYNFIKDTKFLNGSYDKNKFYEFEIKYLKKGEKNFLNFYSFELLEKLAADSFLELDTKVDNLENKEKKDNFFQKSLLPFLGLIIKNFNTKYNEEIKKLKVTEQNKFKDFNNKKFKLEKVITKILIDFYRSSKENYSVIFNDIEDLNEIFIKNSEGDIFISVNNIYLKIAATFFEKIKIKKDSAVKNIKGINLKIKNRFEEGKNKVNLFKSDIKTRKDTIVNKKDEVVAKTANFLENFIKNETLRNSKKIEEKNNEIKKLKTELDECKKK